ncbi:MAG: glycosyltransferase family 4 protein [Gammaproteobacteria bacterium]
MRIAFLCKRKYMGKDVIMDRYARLYEIPYQLARLGHVVHGYCFSYQGHDEGTWKHDALPGTLSWKSRSPGFGYVPGLLLYPAKLLREVRGFAPDVIIGASDIPHVVLAARIAGRLKVPYVADLYDNFESFGQARIPGMVGTLRRAVRDAQFVTTTSEPLKQLVLEQYAARGTVMAIPSTVDKAIFRRLDRRAARVSLGLPEHAVLIGTAGGLHSNKGVDVLYAAWPDIATRHPDVHLVLAGPIDSNLPPPVDARVHYLGSLPHDRTAEVFNALDVGIIYLRDTAFGRYCFPQKAYEMLACGLPIIAAGVGVMPGLLAATPAALYRPEDVEDLQRALSYQLDARSGIDTPIQDWEQLVGEMNRKLIEIAGINRRL